ncbi:DUF3152 domain-containing protein [Catenuloplanes sp. NPDC051500]|uniref:DUF3152 domain-containing protein n=1 Tax=Catenuloplanes sp. NPDC051500 TaxID=3363959 RepID=UPI0037A64510
MATPGNRISARDRTFEERAAAAAAIRRVRLDPEERRRERRANFGLPAAPMSRALAAPMSRALAATRAEGRPGPSRMENRSRPLRRPVAPAPEPVRRMRYRRRRTGVIALLLAAAAAIGVDLTRGADYRPVSAPGGEGAVIASHEPPTRSAEGRRRAAPLPSATAPSSAPPPGGEAPPPPGGEAPAPAMTATPEVTGTFAAQGSGRFDYAAGPGPILGRAGSLRRFQVGSEAGAGVSADAFATEVDRILGDQRSWIASGQLRLQRVPRGQAAEFTIYLATPKTSERMCAEGGLATSGYTSCRLVGKVIINVARWQSAIPDYGAPLSAYRAYAINHEVGHQLGHGHEACPGAGSPAPVMQQQTYGLRGCLANAWPYLTGRRYEGKPVD